MSNFFLLNTKFQNKHKSKTINGNGKAKNSIPAKDSMIIISVDETGIFIEFLNESNLSFFKTVI